jgi:hypothetical protein
MTDEAIPATAITTGLTEGCHCTVCGAVLAEQQETPVLTDQPVFRLPAALEAVEEEAFAESAVSCVILPEGCLRIDANAFRNCKQLAAVQIPATVTQINATAFEGCSDALVIVAPEGSAAYAFAVANGIRVVAE